MGESGAFFARANWPVGRSGLVTAAFVAVTLVVGGVGAAADLASPTIRPEAGKAPVAQPGDAPEPTPEPSPDPTSVPDFDTLEPKAAPASVALVAAPAPPPSRRAPSGGGSGGGGGGGGGATGGGTESADVLARTNAERAAAGVGGLARNGTLVSYACSWAVQMAASGNFAHSSFPGGFRAWAENIAAGYGSASAVVAGWMGSSGHRANILNGTYTQMGACYADSASGTRYWVQQFGA